VKKTSEQERLDFLRRNWFNGHLSQFIYREKSTDNIYSTHFGRRYFLKIEPIEFFCLDRNTLFYCPNAIHFSNHYELIFYNETKTKLLIL
jgi:hypothetical protein